MNDNESPNNVERPSERSDSYISDDADFVKLFVGQVCCYVANHIVISYYILINDLYRKQ